MSAAVAGPAKFVAKFTNKIEILVFEIGSGLRPFSFDITLNILYNY